MISSNARFDGHELVDFAGVDFDDLDTFDLHHAQYTADAGDTALLIDLENACPGSRRPQRVLRQLRTIVETAGPVRETVAVAASDVVARQSALLTQAGIPVRPVPSGPNAADNALLDEAKQLAERGVRRFVVASGDHIFAKLAKFADLVVVMPAGRPVSARLAGAAREVRVAA